MNAPPRRPSLALVLSGGGARAAYQVGVLDAIAERVPDLHVPIVTGVSAGAINTVYLAAHPGPLAEAARGLRVEWGRLTPDKVYRVPPVRIGWVGLRWIANVLLRRVEGPPVFEGLMRMDPLRRFLAGCVDLPGIARNIRDGRLRAVALTTTRYSDGRTVTFVQGEPDVPVWERHLRLAVREDLTLEHVLASSAIPMIFPAVKIGESFYGDGSVRQTAPLAPAIHLGARRLLVIAMRAARADPGEAGPASERGYPTPAEVLGLLFHSVFLDALDADAERLSRINALLEVVPPGTPVPQGLEPVDVLVLRPSRDVGALARGYLPRLPPLVRFLLRTIGGQRARASDFLSYLLFEPAFTNVLMELGYEDARRRWDEIEAFLGEGG